MTSQTTTKVRLVLCPKCKQILPELPGFSVYQCGGCGTTLQAKKRKDDRKDTGSSLHEADAAEKKEPDQVSEDKKASSINQNATVHSTEESAFNKSKETEQSEFKDDNLEQPRFIHSSDELSSLIGLNCCDNEEPSLEAGTHKEVDEECSLDHNNRRNHKECGGSNFSGEVSSSTEHHSQENVELSPCDGADSEADENEYPLVRKNRRKQKKIEDYNREGPRNGMVSNEVSSSSKLTVHDNKEMNQNEDSNFSVEVSSSTELNCRKNEELVPVPEASIEMNENKCKELLPVPEASIEVNANKYSLEQKHKRVQSEFGDCKEEFRGSINVYDEVSSSPKLTCHEIEEPSPTAGEDDDFKSRFIFRGSSAKNLLTSTPKDQPQKSVSHGFGHVSSVDTLEDTQVHSSAELNLKHRNVGKSPKNRSYDAYQSSVSSYDGIKNQVPKQRQYDFQRNFEDVIPRRDDEYMLNNTMLSDSEMKHQERKSSSTLPEKKRYATEVSKWKRSEWPGSTRNRASQSRLEFYSRDSRMGFENGNPLNYGHKDFESSSSFQSPVKSKYLEEEKMELLRMVYELENQLNRLEVSKERANGRFRKEKRIPPCYGHVPPEVCICNDLKYHRHSGRCSLGKTRPQKCKMTRVPFSEEVTTGRHQVEYSHFRGCRQDLPYSAPLPPHPKCFSKGKYTALHGHKCRIPNNFSPSPQHFSSSEISSWSCETESLDHGRRNRETEKPYLMGRRHFRPIAGGAPFVSCYHCSKLLQLPSEFLLFRRRFHQLQCSACSVVLKFTVQNKTHIVPYTPGVTVAPPPSEVDDHSNQRNLAAHANDRADRVLCSDDYEWSFRRIGSASVTPPFGILKRDSDERKKRHVLKASENKHKNHVETLESAVPLSEKSKVVKLSSEIKEAPPRTGLFKMHR